MYNGVMSNITTKEAAKRLGFTRSRINQLLKAGKFPGAYQVGRAWVIPEEALEGVKRQRKPKS